jgi:hypothetical protein
MAKLTDSARHGIPEKIRGEVWKYLLDVSKPDKGAIMSSIDTLIITISRGNET